MAHDGPSKDVVRNPAASASPAQGKMGELATQAAGVRPNIPVWSRASTEVIQRFPGIHLGRNQSVDGWSAGFTDEARIPVEAVGIDITVSQGSAGFTGISVTARDGFRVAAARFDEATRTLFWEKPDTDSDEPTISLDSDHGKMLQLDPGDSWLETNVGNPGARGGIVRVVDPNGHKKIHFSRRRFSRPTR